MAQHAVLRLRLLLPVGNGNPALDRPRSAPGHDQAGAYEAIDYEHTGQACQERQPPALPGLVVSYLAQLCRRYVYSTQRDHEGGRGRLASWPKAPFIQKRPACAWPGRPLLYERKPSVWFQLLIRSKATLY